MFAGASCAHTADAMPHSSSSPAAIRSTESSVYVADDWRATDKLTLNIGLRYELDTPPTEESNQWANLRPNVTGSA